jgi:hypothetical protein
MAHLKCRSLPIGRFGFANLGKQKGHQLPVMRLDGFLVEFFSGVKAVARLDSIIAFPLLLGSLFRSLMFAFFLGKAKPLEFGGFNFTAPTSEHLRSLFEIKVVAQHYEINNVAASDSTVEAVEATSLDIHGERCGV